jgi:hypothetical protein
MIEMATMAMQLVGYAASQAQRAQLANEPDWAKWVVGGAYVMSQWAAAALEQQKGGSEKFDKMLPAEIRTYLTPPTWDEL